MKSRVTSFLLQVVCASLILGASAADTPFVKKTHAFKTVDDLKIHADVHRPDDSQVRPVIVWIHGGALIMGSRAGVPQRLLELCRTEGFALVSIDYRLAPEVKAAEILADVRDALRWVRGDGAREFHLNPDKLVVSGGSAGGYLTLAVGGSFEPRPAALVAYWGYGDVDGAWYAQPSTFYRTNQPLIRREEALAAVGGPVLTGSDNRTPQQAARSKYYHYLRQNGLWPQEVIGLDPAKDRAKFDPYCPVRHVSPQHPPTLLLHGTVDTDVPYEQSAKMAEALAKQKVPHELVTVPGAGHGLAGGDKQLVEAANARALEFIKLHLR